MSSYTEKLPPTLTADSYANYWRPEKPFFENRLHAGQLLGTKLIKSYRDQLKNPVCLGIARGGLMVAKGVAEFIRQNNIPCELDFLVIRKIGLPTDKEYGIGAMEEDGTICYLDEIVAEKKVDLQSEIMQNQIISEQRELARRQNLFRKYKARSDLTNRTIVIVDECISGGATMSAAIRTARKLAGNLAHIIIATPIASQKAQNRVMALTQLQPENMCIVEVPAVPTGHVWSTNDYYSTHHKATDQDVEEILKIENESSLFNLSFMEK